MNEYQKQIHDETTSAYHSLLEIEMIVESLRAVGIGCSEELGRLVLEAKSSIYLSQSANMAHFMSTAKLPTGDAQCTR